MLYTAKRINEHEHVVFISENKAECSVNNGHIHNVIIIEGMPPILEDAMEHSHELEEGIEEDKSEIKKDKDRINEVVELYKYASTAEEKSREKAKEAVDFYKGEQWDDAIKQKMNQEQRACLTVNLVASMIDLLSGYFRRNRTDFRYKPVENGDSKMADILFIATKQILTKM